MMETLAPETIVAKGEFAKLLNVSAARVSQYISEGKIGPDALVGEGRSARIRVDVATRQIREKRDPGQALANGLFTRLDAASPAQPSPDASTGPRPDSLDEQYKREKLRAIQAQNRKAAEDEEERRGRFTDTAQARVEMSRIAASVIQSFEGALPQVAAALAAKFSVPQRDALHLLRHEFRSVRSQAAERHAADAQTRPETVEVVVTSEEIDV